MLVGIEVKTCMGISTQTPATATAPSLSLSLYSLAPGLSGTVPPTGIHVPPYTPEWLEKEVRGSGAIFLVCQLQLEGGTRIVEEVNLSGLVALFSPPAVRQVCLFMMR